jgi:hypothetical protein
MADRFAHGECIRSEKPALGASRAKSDDGKATPRTPRNEKAVKLLKTNNSAKSPISRPNDFKDLRPPVRNRSFRTRNESFRFSRFFAFADAVDFAAEAGNPSADRAVLRKPSGCRREMGVPPPPRHSPSLDGLWGGGAAAPPEGLELQSCKVA